jgi:choloylglycine hydrolase
VKTPLRCGTAAALFTGLLAPLHPAEACTTFCLSDGERHLVGKSYDWDLEEGLVLANPRGLRKRALVFDPRDQPATWVAQHASLTFNQYGRELPNGGMNDAGLVVEIMWLDGSEAPPRDERAAVTELQWIQLQLDTHATVAEMVATAQDVRVAVTYGKVHYLACDASGECAAFENLGGRMQVTHGKALASKVLTNDPYARSVATLTQHVGFGGKRPLPEGRSSLSRFVRASALVARTQKASKDAVLAVLEHVRNGDYTKWQIVYDPSALRVYFRTRSRKQVKEVDLRALASSCPAEARMLDMNGAEAGDVTSRFQPYRRDKNQTLLQSSLAPVAGRLAPGAASLISAYPSTLSCDTGRP